MIPVLICPVVNGEHLFRRMLASITKDGTLAWLLRERGFDPDEVLKP